MRYAGLENKIRRLDEQENEGQWTDELARKRREKMCTGRAGVSSESDR